MTKELLTLSMKELARYEIIKQIIKKEINATIAAAKLCLSTRQIRNLKRRVKEKGIKGLIHGNRGKPSNRKICQETIDKAVNHLNKTYRDFKPSFASEKLQECHGITLSGEKVRQLMMSEGLWKVRSRKENKEYRRWRERKEYYGEMEQFDGSYHDWFEGRAPKDCLLASIDDATGNVTRAEFSNNEGIFPVFGFWKGYLEKHGKPSNIYLDRYSTYKVNIKSVVDDPAVVSQFERAMQELDIKVIHARSPQAKGRIERLFGTLQDRLVKELRLAGISDREKANQFLQETFLPKFNEKFSVVPAKKGDAHRTLSNEEQERISTILCIKTTRSVQNDFTVRFKGQWFQLSQSQPLLVTRKEKIIVEERMTGQIFLSLRGKYLSFKLLSVRPEKVRIPVIAIAHTMPAWIPPANHPWRKQSSQKKDKAAVFNFNY